jgi:hypothetical protein
MGPWPSGAGWKKKRWSAPPAGLLPPRGSYRNEEAVGPTRWLFAIIQPVPRSGTRRRHGRCARALRWGTRPACQKWLTRVGVGSDRQIASRRPHVRLLVAQAPTVSTSDIFRAPRPAALAVALAISRSIRAAEPPSPSPADEAAALSLTCRWCGGARLHEFKLDIAQQGPFVRATLMRKTRVREIDARLEGNVLRASARGHTPELRPAGSQLRITGGTGMLAMRKGQFFTRTDSRHCPRAL